MNVLVVGSGGREHALAWKLKQSELVDRLFITPGNAGIALEAGIECMPIVASDYKRIIDFCKETNVEFVVIGPDQALADGLADHLQDAGISCFGPKKAAAKIETSKSFAKEMMKNLGIPTAEFSTFSNVAQAKDFIEQSKWEAWVVKADGLALGKGVVICHTKDEAKSTAEEFLTAKALGNAGSSIVIEEFLVGREVSAFHFCDGKESRFLGFACDYKQIHDAGKGPNTGGMGAYSPVDWVESNLHEDVSVKIIQPLLNEMKKRGHPFQGMLFTGLIITKDGPKVLEFNARFGDPETQALLPLMDEDLLPWLRACAKGELHSKPPAILCKKGAAVHVVMASFGYPGIQIRKGDPITISGEFFASTESKAKSPVKVFFAGVSAEKAGTAELKTGGGRVLGVTSLATTREQARKIAYENLKKIFFDGAQMRGDIGE